MDQNQKPSPLCNLNRKNFRYFLDLSIDRSVFMEPLTARTLFFIVESQEEDDAAQTHPQKRHMTIWMI